MDLCQARGWWVPERHKERKDLNSLNALVKAPVPKTVEMVIGHFVDFPDQDIVHLPQQVMTRVTPLLGRYLDESLRNNVRVVIREFPCSSPVK